MHIRTFRAANLNDALAMIRDQMGPEASVLHTRQVPAARLNPFGRKRVEVTAGLKPLRCSEPSPSLPEDTALEDTVPEDTALEDTVPAGPVPERTAADGLIENPLLEDDLHASDSTEEPTGSLSPPLAERPRRALADGLANRLADRLVEGFVDELIDGGLPRRIATEWAARSAGASAAPIRRGAWLSEAFAASDADRSESAVDATMESARAALARWLEGSLRIGNSIEAGRGEAGRGGRRVVALVGPTGVGKTTTIAKLAAGFQMQQNVRVGLLTLDTFRAAAIEQLDVFARALGVPLAVARSSAEVAGALERLGEVDLVLIDTVGQSPRGEERIAALGRLLAAARPDETHLVIDATGSFASAADVCMAFKPLQPTAAIISKLDEVWRPAPAIAAVLEGALQISYVTTGQRVPEDIAVAGRETLAAAASGLAAAGCGA